MEHYLNQIELYFELKDTPMSSRESYRRRMQAFLVFLGERERCLAELTTDDIQQYILHLKKEKGLAPGTINNYISGIKFLYTYVLKRAWDRGQIPRMKRVAKMPVIPAKEDVLALLNSTDNLKHRAILMLLYGSGLRVGEAVSLRISDICSKTMRVRIASAKHGTTRYSILSQNALVVLRSYFRNCFSDDYQPDDWLFPGQRRGEHLNVKTVKNTIIKLRDKLELDGQISAHTLRHCFATHAIEDRVELAFIQQMLGHRDIKTTAGYLHMTSKSLLGVQSPLDTK